MNVPFEDNYEDVLNKAMHGLGLTPVALSRQTGLPVGRIESVLDGNFDSGIVVTLTRALKLHGPSLFELATKGWYPDEVRMDGLAMFNTPCPVPGYQEMTVNNYLIWDPVSKKAAAFDTGANVDEMLEVIESNHLNLSLICLTHKHDDHIKALPELLAATGNPPVHTNILEPVPGAEKFEVGKSLFCGYLQIETCLTAGHSPGGTTYVISGLEFPVAIVGDSIFCCSMGGAYDHYQAAREMIADQILTLPDETILCPGHGPMTTVEQEQIHNPFFATDS